MIRLGVPVGLAFVYSRHIHGPCNRLTPTSVSDIESIFILIFETLNLIKFRVKGKNEACRPSEV